MTAVIDPPVTVATLDIDPERQVQRREEARNLLGVTGTTETEPLRPILREHSVTLYPMVALGLLGIVDTFQSFAFGVLTPEISHALGLSLSVIGGVRSLAYIGQALAPLPMAALSQTRGRRAILCLATAVAWSLITLFTGFVTSVLALVAVLVFDGLSTGSVAALHAPILFDSYPPRAKVRILSGYQGVVTLGAVASPLFVALLTGPLNLTWRGVFLIMGLTSVATTMVCLGLRDPGVGKFDTQLVRAAEHEAVTGEAETVEEAEADGADIDLKFFEIFRRLLLIPTLKRVAAGYFAVGILLIPFLTFLSSFLSIRWNLGPSARGLFFAGLSAVAIVNLVLFGRFAERAFRDNPARVMRLCGLALAGCVVFIALGAVAPVFVLMFVLFAAGESLLAVLAPGLNAGLYSIIDAKYRPHAAALVGIFTAAGGLIGSAFLGGVNEEFGTAGAIVALLVPGFIAAAIIYSTGDLINGDLDRMIDEVLEDEDIRILTSQGKRLPLLAARGLDFSYGQLQVLFDVNLTVDEGEMVALLGTNGAGKSTLLKVISGIGLPTAGTVRFRGEEITYLDAERRVPLGISQIPGGRAVFPTLDVVENLKAYGYGLGRDRKRMDEAVDECFEAFPRLFERRSSLAATLSGGEQQMLGLSKALILRPKLLLIDELSLGLAPVIVGQLLDMVRKINNTGTAVVLVEQSVNIALSLVDHAYFMEKGEMRFDGPSKELLARDDLLRAVFLEGASKGNQK